MPIVDIYSVYDVKSEMYSPPMVAVTRGVILRQIQDLLREGKHMYARHPEDYVLFYLGTFDEHSADFVHPAAPVSVLSLASLREDPVV